MDFLLELRYKSLAQGLHRSGDGMELSQVTLGAVLPEEEARFRALMGTHHYLGAAPKVGETLWYGAAWRGEWVALASFSAAALKCQARDAWIGWTLRHKYDRLHLVANNTRFLILRPVPNLGSRVLGLCARHLVRDWPARFHHPLVLLETFVDPSRFVGTVYRAAGWTELGMTRGFRRVRGGYLPGIPGDFHRPAFCISTRPAPAAASDCAAPTRSECPEIRPSVARGST